MRRIADALHLRMRGEVARKEFDAAIRTAQTMLVLARSFNEHPTLIGHLVGLAIANMALNCLEELSQQPGAPNLFWALTELPSPLLQSRSGTSASRLFFALSFGPSDHELKPWDEKEQAKALARLLNYLGIDEQKYALRPGYRREATAKWSAWLTATDTVTAAKKRLLAGGVSPAVLDKLPAMQTSLVDLARELAALKDEILKWSSVPYWQAADGTAAAENRFQELLNQFPDKGLWLKQSSDINSRVLLTQARTQQWVGLLQAVEAVRGYAAENGGKLPTALEGMKLPIPVDPFTGKPFHYEVKDGTAIIRGTPPPDRKAASSFNRVYEITIRK
jgi:hypothetical protein